MLGGTQSNKMSKHMSYEQRFLQKVNKTDSCWIWTGATNSRGYGSFRFNGKSVLSHRFSYQHFNGNIPEGMLICHRCDVPVCVNPEHLWVGSQLDNSNDKYAKNRQVISSGNQNGHNQYKNNKMLKGL